MTTENTAPICICGTPVDDHGGETDDCPTSARVTLTDDEIDRLDRVGGCDDPDTIYVFEQILTDRRAAWEAEVRAQATSDEARDEAITPALYLLSAARDAGMDYGTYSELFDAVESIPADLAARIAGGEQV